MNLDGVVAVVTGGGGTIGSQVRALLAERGAVAVGWDRDLADGVLACDVSDPGSVEAALTATIEQAGTPHVLVNAAGVSGGRSPWAKDAGPDDWSSVLSSNATWDAVFRVNVMGVVNCSREFARACAGTGEPGAIVNITSIGAGPLTDPALTAYSASKAAVNALTRVAAMDFAHLGIRVNAIAPGMMEARMRVAGVDAPSPSIGTGAADASDLGARLAATTPLGHRLCSADDIAQAVLALLDAEFVTGQVLIVDGGLTLRSFSGS